MSVLKDSHGSRVVLGPLLGKGGEGDVFAVIGPERTVAKRYHQPVDGERERKLIRMVQMRTAELSRQAAWPIDLVRDGSGRCVGFIMPKVDEPRVIDRLSHPAERAKHFHDKDFKFLVTVAHNLAAAAGVLHSAGVVIGDVNESNVCVRANGEVAFIDADSFQIQGGSGTFFCRVAKDLYLPPELIGQDLSRTIRTPNHDGYGLAVLVFQLLMQGRHPVVGRWLNGPQPDFAALLARGAYAYSERQPRLMEPPPGTLPVAAFGEITELFERAFRSVNRPRAADWSAALDRFNRGLRPCRSNSRHAIFPGGSQCEICRLPRDPLPGTAPSYRPQAGAAISLEELLKTAFGLPEPAPPARLPDEPGLPRASNGLARFPRGMGEGGFQRATSGSPPSWFGGVVFLTCSVLLTIVALLWTASGAGKNGPEFLVIGLVVCAVASFMLYRTVDEIRSFPKAQQKASAFAAAKFQCEAIQESLRAAEAEHARAISRYPQLQSHRQTIGQRAQALGKKYDDHQAKVKTAAQDYAREWRQERLAECLLSEAVEEGEIPGIGDERLRILASYNIETAADLMERAIRGVPGFGDVLTSRLLDWRSRQVAQLARMTPPPMPPQYPAQMQLRFLVDNTKEIEGLRQEMDGFVRGLTQFVEQERSLRARVEQKRKELREAVGRLV